MNGGWAAAVHRQTSGGGAFHRLIMLSSANIRIAAGKPAGFVCENTQTPGRDVPPWNTTMTSQPSSQQLRSTRRSGAPLLFGITIAFAAAAAVGGAPVGAAVADRPLLPPSSETIRYQVNGSPGVAAYLNYAIDYTQQYQTNVPLPWTKEFTVPPGQVYVLSAQSSGTGSITCTISIDGKVVSNMTSTGTPARAACSH
ncbi:hypothetical protein AWC32_10105 [Mycobacterium xenopi]|nr:hypothetical protein AWC32_10105 [Mycobacterium xenopi]